MQLPLLVPSSSWKPPRISSLPQWSIGKRIAVDIETCDPSLRKLGPGVRRGAYITGISFAIEDTPHKYYIPLRHLGGDNVEDVEQALHYVRENAKHFTGEIVGANLSYDLDFLAHVGINFPQIKMFRDVQIAEPLIDELQMSFSLENICRKYLGVGKTEYLLKDAACSYGVDPKKEMYKLPARFVGEYAEDDAVLPLKILRRQEKEIDDQDLWNIYNIESKLLPVLVRMRRRGVKVSLDKLARVEWWSKEQENLCLSEIFSLTGVTIPFNSVWQVAGIVPALQAIGCTIPITPKTKKPSIDKVFLSSIDHPVAKAIARARRVNKIRTTFCQSIRDHLIGDRIHCTFHQLRTSSDDDAEGEGDGARYGRCSSSDPNMQQQPARDPEIGPMWRDIFIPEEGELWCSGDFSTQEPRQAVHYANKVDLGYVKVRTPTGWLRIDANESARNVADSYRNDPKTDPHAALGMLMRGRPVTKLERDQTKIIFLGLSYGMGGAKLCKQLGYSTIMAVYDNLTGRTVSVDSEEGRRAIKEGARIFEAAGAEGQDLLDKFDASVPFVKALNKICQKAVNSKGYIRTQAGRKCRFPRDPQGNLEFTHKALNRLIQGSAADQTKETMLELDRQGFFMTLQIHDECCFSIKNKEEGKLIGEIMENTYKLIIPSKVDVEIGNSWGTAK